MVTTKHMKKTIKKYKKEFILVCVVLLYVQFGKKMLPPQVLTLVRSLVGRVTGTVVVLYVLSKDVSFGLALGTVFVATLLSPNISLLKEHIGGTTAGGTTAGGTTTGGTTAGGTTTGGTTTGGTTAGGTTTGGTTTGGTTATVQQDKKEEGNKLYNQVYGDGRRRKRKYSDGPRKREFSDIRRTRMNSDDQQRQVFSQDQQQLQMPNRPQLPIRQQDPKQTPTSTQTSTQASIQGHAPSLASMRNIGAVDNPIIMDVPTTTLAPTKKKSLHTPETTSPVSWKPSRSSWWIE